VIVELWPGKTERQKKQLAERTAQDVMDVLRYGVESVSVAFEMDARQMAQFGKTETDRPSEPRAKLGEMP
jgi:phenylpyruvate tautomerase PptA (4-oxalocrotonate tautomerase family)